MSMIAIWQSIVLSFDRPVFVYEVGIAFFKGNERKALFDILVKTQDGLWEEILVDGNSAKGNGIESYDIMAGNVVAVKIVGYGSVNFSSGKSDPWNSITEVGVYPKVLDDIVGNEDQLKTLRSKSIVNGTNIPNILICGPSGTGKTTIMKTIAYNIHGDQRDTVLEINASDNRSVDSIRNVISNFCKLRITLRKGNHKIVLIDEAECLSTSSQQALRRIIELYSDNTRFILSCTSSIVLIEPIIYIKW